MERNKHWYDNLDCDGHDQPSWFGDVSNASHIFLFLHKMGIKGFGKKFIDKHLLVHSTVHDKIRHQTIIVDLCGTFYADIQSALHAKDLQRLVRTVNKYFEPSEAITFVIDGNTNTEEKSYAREKRNAKLRDRLQQLENIVSAATDHLDSGGKRISKSRWIKMEKLVKSTITVDMKTKQEIKASLLAAGYTAVIAPGEADVWIAKHPANALNVVSGDSDMCFHQSVATWYRPRRSKGFLVFDVVKKETVMARLQLSQSKWSMLAFLLN